MDAVAVQMSKLDMATLDRDMTGNDFHDFPVVCIERNGLWHHVSFKLGIGTCPMGDACILAPGSFQVV